MGIGPLDSAVSLLPQEVTRSSGSAADFPVISFVRKKALNGVVVNVEIATSLDFATKTGSGAGVTDSAKIGEPA